VFAVLLKVLLLTAILDRGETQAAWILLLTPMAGRLGIVTAAAAGKPARTDGSGRLFLEGVYAWQFLIALVFSLAMLLIGWAGRGRLSAGGARRRSCGRGSSAAGWAV
jgi:cobalamin synthase